MAGNEAPWWKKAVFYGSYPRSFKDSNGDGNGDLRGVIEKLAYLKDLGVDALWLTPIFTSPWRDSGYDIADYDSIDPAMGTMEDFQELIAEAHRRELRVILDLVMNHTSDKHPWFEAARSSRDNPFRDFYIWRPARDGAEPNNWKSLVEGSAWAWDETTGEYYLHLFSRYQPDLNWQNPQVKEAIFAMMRRWLDKGVDGFRMDVVNCIMKPAGLPDAAREANDDAPYVLDRSLYADNPGIHELLREMRREVLNPSTACAIGEVHFNTKDMAALYVDPARQELDMIFQTDLLFDRRGTASIRRSLSEWNRVLEGRGWNGFCFGNHDTPRQLTALGDETRFRTESAKALATLSMTAPGSPFIYQGDELGMSNVFFENLADYRDIEMKSAFDEKVADGVDPLEALELLRPRSRDNARTPFQWSAGRNAGFTTGVPWIGVNLNHTQINAEEQETDPASVLSFYRRLASLRREHPSLALGSYEAIEVSEDVIAYRRSLDGESLLVAVNLSSRSIEVSPAIFAVENLLGNYPAIAREAPRLRPWEARILRA